MNYLISIILFGLLSSCASTSDNRVKELEDKIEKLTKSLEKPAEPEKKEVVYETPTLNLSIPVVQDKTSSSIKNQITLGVVSDIEFVLLFDSLSYWLVLKPLKPDADVNGVVTMNVTHENKSPESFNFFTIKEGVYKTFGDNINGHVDLEIIFTRENKKSIVFNVEATI